MASYVKSVQQVSIAIASGSTSNTATIAGVDTTKAMIIYQGLTTSSTSALQSVVSRVELTNATTVTATRGASNSDSVIVCAVVVEFASDVNSIQAGTINLNSALSNTATITAVGANAFVLWLGQSSATAATALSRITSAVDLTNSTTVTAHAGTTNSNLTVGYMVVDLSSNIVNSVQKLAHNDTSNTASYTDTITSVIPANAILLANGDILAGGTGGANFEATRQLTNSTTVTYTLGAASATSKTHYTTVLEFKGAALNSSVQRGVNSLSTATSHAATISPVNASYAFCNLAGWRMTSSNPSIAYPNQALTNSTTVTSTLNSAGSAATSYEVAEFIAPANGVASSAGSGIASAVGAATIAALASSAGSGGAPAAGGASAASVASTTGQAIATASGAAQDVAAGTSSGTATAQATGGAVASSVASATGASAAQGVDVTGTTAVAVSAGTSTSPGVGASTMSGLATGVGASMASAVGAIGYSSAATSSGFGSAAASGLAGTAGIGGSAGASGCIAISSALAQSIAYSAGLGLAAGMGAAAAVTPSHTPTPSGRRLAADAGQRGIAVAARKIVIDADSINRII